MINRLNAKQTYQLAEFTNQHYVKANMTDAEFAKHASTELGFPISEYSVGVARATFEIPRKNAWIKGADKTYLQSLETRIRILEQRVEVYLSGAQK